MTWYLDSSAILKLLIAEKESAALTDFINFTIKSSALTRVEVIRTLHKIAPERVADAKVILAGMDLSMIFLEGVTFFVFLAAVVMGE